MRKMFAGLFFIVILSATCTHVPIAGIPIPTGVIDCGLKGITEMVVDIIDDVNSCIAAGKQGRCGEASPEGDVTKTPCEWKRCLWDKARPQGKANATEALLCAVEQSGIDFGATANATGDAAPRAAQSRASEFISETKVSFAHRPNQQ